MTTSPCPTEAAYERMTAAAVRIADLIDGDPSGAVLDAAQTEYRNAKAEFEALF